MISTMTFFLVDDSAPNVTQFKMQESFDKFTEDCKDFGLPISRETEIKD